MKILIVAVLFLLVGTTAAFGQQTSREQSITKTLDDFQQAIVDNDVEKARTLLADSVRILEGGHIEQEDEYLSHHFHADGKFLSAMNREIETRNVMIHGNAAWVTTKTHTWGSYNDRELDLIALELAVLKREGGQWQITALHWSSAQQN